MKPTKYLSVAIALILGAASFSPQARADQASETFKVKAPAGITGAIGTEFENIDEDRFASQMFATTTPENYDLWRTYKCDSLSSQHCTDSDLRVWFNDVFSPCTKADQVDCIDGLSATLKDGTVVKGELKKVWNKGATYKGDSSLGISDGGSTSSWLLPGTNPGGSEVYGIDAGIYGQYFNDGSDFVNRQLFASVQPINIVSGNYGNSVMVLTQRGNKGVGWGGANGDSPQPCQVVEPGACGMRTSFPLDVRYTLKMRLGRSIPAWMSGRLDTPDIQTDAVNENQTNITITAGALQVPYVGGWLAWDSAPEAIKSMYPQGAGGIGMSQNAFTTTDLSHRVLLASSQNAGSKAITDFNAWIPYLDNKPAAMRTLWSVNTITWDQNSSQQMNKCAGKNFSGLVTSNAAVYSDGPPAFDKAAGSMNYTVGAPHFDVSGNVFQGVYSLALRSEVARCLYGFSKAPVSASIQIASADGTPDVAVTTLSERDGWLRLSAAGFHYSTPQIKVTLTQAGEHKADAVTTSPKVSPAKKPATITCVKGKVSKVVTGKSCPSGYKRK